MLPLSTPCQASATSTVRVSSACANNLIRSPVEFAHASLTPAGASHGRFTAGLGAGWEAAEIRGVGLDFPDAAHRARRSREAVLTTRDLLRNRPRRFQGRFYDTDVPALGPGMEQPSPLGAAVTMSGA